MKNSEPNSAGKLTAAEAETIKSLLNYPTLEQVFDANNLASIRQKMRSTIEDLERVIRRGTKDDAEKASRTVKAVQKTLDFLDEIESSRQSKAK